MNKETPNPLVKVALKIYLTGFFSYIRTSFFYRTRGLSPLPVVYKIEKCCKTGAFKIYFLGIVINLITNLSILPSTAQNLVNPPLELDLINEPDKALSQGLFTFNTISQEGITNPSLWWIRDQFGRQVVTNWLGYPQERRVDIVVDRQIWSFINYVEKYSLVNHFALTAREYGYNLRIFNDQGLPLGNATCEFTPPSDVGVYTPSNCQINLLLLSDRGLPANRRRVPTFF